MFKSAAKIGTAVLMAGSIAIAGAGAAQAATLKWTITNSFGSTITLDTASCSSGTSVSAPFSIASGSTVTVNATTAGASDLCFVRSEMSTCVAGPSADAFELWDPAAFREAETAPAF